MSNIPSPKVLPGMQVVVANYRAKGKWENGTCTGAEYKLWGLRNGKVRAEDEGHWSYTVNLTRTSRAGNNVWLYVNGYHVEPQL